MLICFVNIKGILHYEHSKFTFWNFSEMLS